MAELRTSDALDLKAALILTVVCLIWGLNAVAIKFSNTGIAPVFCAGLRSVIATVAGILFLKEPLTLKLIFSLVFVSLGIYIVNRE